MTCHYFIGLIKHTRQAYMALNEKYKWRSYWCKWNFRG